MSDTVAVVGPMGNSAASTLRYLSEVDLVSDEAMGVHSPRALENATEEFFQFQIAMVKFENEVYEAGLRAYFERTSVMTRQRLRAVARESLMRINEWPKNRDARKNRRKSVLGSVASFVKMQQAQAVR